MALINGTNDFVNYVISTNLFLSFKNYSFYQSLNYALRIAEVTSAGIGPTNQVTAIFVPVIAAFATLPFGSFRIASRRSLALSLVLKMKKIKQFDVIVLFQTTDCAYRSKKASFGGIPSRISFAIPTPVAATPAVVLKNSIALINQLMRIKN